MTENHKSNETPLGHEAIQAYKFASDYLRGRVILVTGAGDGIGQVAAITYAKHGARVILAGKTIAKLENTFDLIIEQQKVAKTDNEPVIFPIDFNGASEQDYDQMSINIEESLGGLDGVLFNASALGSMRPISGFYLSDWDACFNVNLRSQFLMTKALLPVLERSQDGRIIYTTSSVGRKGRAHWGAYSVSKFATEGLMQVLAEEMDGASAICVNAINPGATRTKMRARAYPAENPVSLALPEQLMPLYLYLMGPASKGINGYSLDAQQK